LTRKLQPKTLRRQQTAEIKSAANNEAQELANSQAAEEANSTYLAAQVDKIESLIEQQRFEEARAVYRETDKFIPDQQVSNALMLSIENAERLSRSSTTTATNREVAPEVVPEPTPVVQPAPEPAPTQQALQRPAPQPVEQSAPRVSFVDAQGPVADHLNQLREAIEAKDIDRVTSVSSNLPRGRVQHLTRLFKIYDRLDVTIVDVVSRGNTTTATLNVSMFNERETGGYYLATKWDGAALKSSTTKKHHLEAALYCRCEFRTRTVEAGSKGYIGVIVSARHLHHYESRVYCYRTGGNVK